MASQTAFRSPQIRSALRSFRGLRAALLPALLALPLLTGCGVSSSGPAGSPIAKEQAALATGTVPSTFFGLVVKDSSAPTPAVASGARRLWDSGVTWAALEPAPGVFDWATLDAEVAAAENSGAALTLTLGMTPSWASFAPSLPSAYGPGATGTPARLADWDSYVAAVAARYKGRIGAYELWNAPEDPAYWSGSPATLGSDLATLAAHAAACIHSADPAAMLVSPALSPAGLQAFLTAGGGASIDVVGAALTLPGQSPETGVATLQAVRAAMQGTPADAKPVWNDSPAWTFPGSSQSAASGTQAGAHTAASAGGAALDPQTQAAYTARTLILNAAFAVTRMHWYAWDDNTPSSIALTQFGRPTAAAQAYAQVETWLAGARLNGCAANASGLWTCQLAEAGRTGYIVWSAIGTVTASSLGMANATALDGTAVPLAADGSLQVGGSPLLLQ